MQRYKFVAIPFLLYVAYLHFYQFYGQFGIDIKYWIGIDEFFVLFFDDLAAYTWDLLIVVIGGYAVLYTHEKTRENPRHIEYNNRERKKWKIKQTLLLMAIAAVTSLSIVYLVPKDGNEKIIDAIQAVVVMIILSVVIWFRENVEKHFNTKFLKSDILVFLVAITLMVNSLTSAAKKRRQIFNSTSYAKVTLKNSEAFDSLIYLGSTSRYHFLFAKKDGGHTFALDRNAVQNIKIKQKNGSFNIYN